MFSKYSFVSQYSCSYLVKLILIQVVENKSPTRNFKMTRRGVTVHDIARWEFDFLNIKYVQVHQELSNEWQVLIDDKEMIQNKMWHY